MPKKNIIILITITAISFITIASLYTISDPPFEYSQKFSRTFQQYRIANDIKILNLKNTSYYVAGESNNKIYLGNNEDTLTLLVTDTTLTSQKYIPLSISNKGIKISQLNATKGITLNGSIQDDYLRLRLKGSTVEIDSPFFYIKAGGLPAIFRGSIDDWIATITADSIPYFTNATPLGKGSFAFMVVGAVEKDSLQNIICKYSPTRLIELNPTLLKGQIDKLYSTMGILRYSKHSNILTYTYSFRNEIIALDTNLNLKFKFNTLDPVSYAQINPIELKNELFTMASPPAITNNNVQICKNMIFIQSNLKASNESKRNFNNSSVIDVYDLNMKRYKFSFYISDYKQTKLKHFKIFGNRLLAIYDRYAVLYRIDLT